MRITPWSVLILAAAPACALAQFLPPPVLPPAELQQRIDGYDVATIYQRWHQWIEREKGPVLDAIVQQSASIDGLGEFGPIVRYASHGVHGPFSVGEVRAYCRRLVSEPFGPIAGTCVYRFTRSTLPQNLPTDSRSAPLLKDLRRLFDARAIVARLRAAGVGPDDPRPDELDRIFAAGPSPRALLRASADTMQLDSRRCPDLGSAVERLEGQRAEFGIDLNGVGADSRWTGPRPHAAYRQVTLTVRNGVDFTTIEDIGGPASRLATPILDAAAACDVKYRPLGAPSLPAAPSQ